MTGLTGLLASGLLLPRDRRPRPVIDVANRTMRTNHRQAGFTLVEIAIVLVIIGLLLGGILKGQEMITQARIKNIVNDFNGITAAYFSYQDRYRAIPGDDRGAFDRWGTAYGAQNGDQDSVLGENGKGYNNPAL